SPEIAHLSRLAQQRKAAFAETAAQASWGILLGEAPVVAVYSPKGGSGGTTVALNLVGALSRRYPGQVLLIDLDLPYDHAALSTTSSTWCSWSRRRSQQSRRRQMRSRSW